MHPRHVPLIVLLLGGVVCWAAVSTLDYVSTLSEAAALATPATEAPVTEPAAAPSRTQVIEAANTYSMP